MAMYHPTVISNPAGTFHFVGTVPAVLAYHFGPMAPEVRDYLLDTAVQCGMGLARRAAARFGVEFGTLTFPTREAAVSFAAEHGYSV